MNLPTILIGLIVLGVFVAIVGTSIRNHKNGKGGCSCGDSCGGCACAGMCHPEEKKCHAANAVWPRAAVKPITAALGLFQDEGV